MMLHLLTAHNTWLLVAAALSGVAAFLHIGIVFGGGPWYRFFGAGERMASAADVGRTYPAIVTLCIASVLGLWAAYALSGAGVIAPLPWLKGCLAVITAVYLLRGLAIVPTCLFSPADATLFMVWSSVICIALGVLHLVGVTQVWSSF